MSWIDSLHTNAGILVSVSAPIADESATATISAFGTYFVGEGQPRWGWRTEIDDASDGALQIRMFNVKPDGEESVGVAIDLSRDDGH